MVERDTLRPRPANRPKQDSRADGVRLDNPELVAEIRDHERKNAVLAAQLQDAQEELRAARVEPAAAPAPAPTLPVVSSEPSEIDVGKLAARVVVGGQRWRIGVPLALLAPIVLFLWTQLQNYLELGRQVKALNLAVASYEDRMGAEEKTQADLKGEIASLRETEAKLSGYLAGALPLAGVAVPGAERGSIEVDIDRDPDKVGAKKRPQVVTHTRIPAPAPTQ
jgi:hypothetical protein